ncbi:hypothetical protein GCM10011613_11990 [Cellvibrio zantedeschiae]|uniref:PEP-CTERM protein-sorting domain-containing protein n=1 Tax=Cellvibrio zantedeschiae TaxID=1237077 RepID=A0ABQ3AVM8_9GAMM|nr:hypothetical protein [Cellvibrio zantedeschiae]GGY69276.1 hypothetical protein GCM10011613_11990 [Cellvibrio zantedeschiae]
MQKVLFVIFVSLFSIVAKASIIYESAAGGFDSTFCCGSILNTNQYIGATFTINEKTKIDAVGGHFMASKSFGGNLFGAIVRLNNSGYPSNSAFKLDNILAYTIFTPETGKDYLAPIAVNLDSGSYGIVFGAGLFGTSGFQALTLLQSQPSFSNGRSYGTSPGRNWHIEDSMPWARYRIIVSGERIVNAIEPSSLFLLIFGVLCIFLKKISLSFHRKNTVG